jgi:hypothetical protein
MNAADILKYGHLFVLGTIEELPDGEWETPNVCGVWSSKQIIAHLASFEHLLNEVLRTFEGEDPGPYMLRMAESPQAFNDYEIASRDGKSAEKLLLEYAEWYSLNVTRLSGIPANLLPQAGTMPWYGNEYSLDDYIVYSFYGHKREHMAQINVFKDSLGL